MLINALCEYADLKEKNDSTPKGWAKQAVHYCIVLSPDGKIESITDLRIAYEVHDKKGKTKTVFKPKEILFPKRIQKTTTDPKYIDHRPLYIFGLNFDKASGKFTPDDKTDKARKSHQAFVKHEDKFTDGLDSPMCKAYRSFFENWVPENETENPELMKIGSNYSESKFVFALGESDNFINDDPQLKERYDSIAKSAKQDSNTNTAVCGILGERLPIARLHDTVNLPYGKPANSGRLVSMNEKSSESYGKKQSYNSNVSELAMKKYTSMLKFLLKDKDHHILIDKMTVIFFAMKENDSAECKFMSMLIGGVNDESSVDATTENDIIAAGKHIKSGIAPDISKYENIDENVTFYIAGFTPNGPRICQKFIYKNSFGSIVKNMRRHQEDLRIKQDPKRQIYFNSIKRELVPPKKGGKQNSDSRDIPPPLMAGIMLAAFNGTKYPDGMLATVIERIKVDSDDDKNHFIKLNDTRAGIIKACLNRKHKREVITMSWNTENKNPAYLCGGLFAVYEQIQRDCVKGDLNTTIKDAYFSAACSRPISVFPKLAKLSVYHMRKLDEKANIYYSKLLQELTDGLDGAYPKTLSLDDQGCFIVGYYQMNSKLYTSNKTDKKEDQNG